MTAKNSYFFSLKSFIPNLFSTSKDKVSTMVTSLTVSESDYITKTENTESDIRELLESTMEMEQILGLKFLMGVYNPT